jgi:N-acetylglutamate synthase-like GNAT family acetyltransferase
MLPKIAVIESPGQLQVTGPGDLPGVELRHGAEADAAGIHGLIMANLASGHLLPRSLTEIAACAGRFRVAVRGPEVVACAELAHLGPGVAEVRSLVVHESARGLGRRVIEGLRQRARADRYRTLCAFTHDPRFFVRLGFSIVPHSWLPEKVAADCWSCPLFRTCGQYAVVDATLSQGPLVPGTGREVS